MGNRLFCYFEVDFSVVNSEMEHFFKQTIIIRSSNNTVFGEEKIWQLLT